MPINAPGAPPFSDRFPMPRRLRRHLELAGQTLVLHAPASARLGDVARHLGIVVGDATRPLADVRNGESIDPPSHPVGIDWRSDGRRAWRIMSTSGPDALQHLDLFEGDVAVLGRDRENASTGEFVTGLSPLTKPARLNLADRLMSVDHVLVVASGNCLFVADGGSTNGTQLGERQVGPGGVSWPVSEELRVGQTTLGYVSPDADEIGHLESRSFDRFSGTFAWRRRFTVDPSAHHPEPIVAPSVRTQGRGRLRFRPGSLLGPLIGAAVMALLLDPKFAVFAMLSPTMMLVNFADDRRAAAKERQTGERDFSSEFGTFGLQLALAAEAERLRRVAAFVDPALCLARAAGKVAGLWATTTSPGAPLLVRVGIGSPPHAPTLIERGPRSPMVTELLASSFLDRVPVTVPLAPGECVTVVGNLAKNVVRALLLQVATAVRPSGLALLVDDGGLEPVWAGLFPHRVDPALIDGGGVFAEVGQRLLVLAQFDGSGVAAAHQRDVVRDSVVNVAFIVAVERADQACPETTTLVTVDEDGLALIALYGEGGSILDVALDGLREAGIRLLAHSLAQWRDPAVHEGASQLPAALSLDDALQGLAGDEFRIHSPSFHPAGRWSVAEFWRTAACNQRSLYALVGTGRNGTRSLDFVHDGPHALVAGTTGAGKSELLRTLIISLAVRYPPELVTFVLIDYKGGSAFAECADLPHTVGFVTDLDDGLATRSLACLEAELRRREHLLRNVGARDLIAYAGEPRAEAMPRLLLVIDELAALVRDIPNFVGALVSLAQRGRSLGLHLVLATQRPAGTVNDAIRANTNIRIALRVQDSADSSDVLGDASAAAIDRRTPGRAFVRLGPGELEVVQVASVGLRSERDTITVHRADGKAVPADAAGMVPAEKNEQVRQDIERAHDPSSPLSEFVEEINRTFDSSGRPYPRRPWIEPLPSRISWSGNADSPKDGGSECLTVTLGIADAPHEQRQDLYSVDLRAGHLCLIGSVGSGVSTGLRTVALALASRCPPTRTHVYVLDFLGGELAGLAELPHVGAVIGPHEDERRERLLATLERAVEHRRLTRIQTGSTGSTGHEEDDIDLVVIIDGWSALRAASHNPAMLGVSDTLVRLMLEGASVGIHFVLGTDRSASLPTTVAPSFAHRLVLRPADPHESSAAGVVFSSTAARIPGRALVVGRSGVEVQLFATDEADVSAAVALGESSTWTVAPRIEVLPQVVALNDVSYAKDALLRKCSDLRLTWNIPFGVGARALAPVDIRLRIGEPVLFAGPARSGRTTALATVAQSARRQHQAMRIGVLVSSTAARDEWVDRMGDSNMWMLTTSVTELRMWIDQQVGAEVAALVVIDDAERIDDDAGQLAALFVARHPTIRVLVAGRADLLRTAYGHWSAPARRSRHGLALCPNLDTDGELWQSPLPRRLRVRGGPGRGVVFEDGGFEVVQVAQ